MGFENFVLYGAAFFVGLLGDMIFKFMESMQVSDNEFNIIIEIEVETVMLFLS